MLLLEKGDRAGGSMLLSSGFVWRYRDFARFRAECQGGHPVLQRLVYDRLDVDLAWLESLGAPVTARGTARDFSTGVQFDPAGLTGALLEAAGGAQLESPLTELPERGKGPPVVLATGGFQAGRVLVRRHVTPEADSLLLRAAPWSEGDGLRLGLAAGARASEGMDEFYGRAMPAPPARVEARDFVRLGQLYAQHALIHNLRGERYEAHTWSEIDVVQWMARQPGARATFTVPFDRMWQPVRERTVGEMVQAAEEAGAAVHRAADAVSVEVVAGITTTLGGLHVDERARAAPGVYAAGADAGGISQGGYSSGLAAALVLGRVAAESALREA